MTFAYRDADGNAIDRPMWFPTEGQVFVMSAAMLDEEKKRDAKFMSEMSNYHDSSELLLSSNTQFSLPFLTFDIIATSAIEDCKDKCFKGREKHIVYELDPKTRVDVYTEDVEGEERHERLLEAVTKTRYETKSVRMSKSRNLFYPVPTEIFTSRKWFNCCHSTCSQQQIQSGRSLFARTWITDAGVFCREYSK